MSEENKNQQNVTPHDDMTEAETVDIDETVDNETDVQEIEFEEDNSDVAVDSDEEYADEKFDDEEYDDEEYDDEEYDDEEYDDEYDDEYDYETGFFTDIKEFFIDKIDAIKNMDRKVLTKRLCIYVPIAIVVILILTDIIPILPNSYNRSYVGNTYALGETQGNDYEAYGKDMLYVANGSLMCFGPDMKEKAKIDTFSGMPVLKTNKTGVVVYAKNGNNALVMTSLDKYDLKKSEEQILSASVSPDGAYILVTAEAGYTAKLSAFDSSDKCIYKWHTNSNIIDTGIFEGVQKIVAATVEYEGTNVYSKLFFFNTTTNDAPKEVQVENNLITELYVADKDTVIAFGTDYTCAYTPSGSLKWTIRYEGKLLKSFDISDEGNIAFLFNKYNSALSESKIEIYKITGRKIGEYNSELNARAISINNEYCLLSHDSETTLLDNDGDVKKIKTVEYEFDKAVLYQNYNFAFSINNSVAEVMSVRH